jgi:branched-chain amino acid transport system permease protein
MEPPKTATPNDPLRAGWLKRFQGSAPPPRASRRRLGRALLALGLLVGVGIPFAGWSLPWLVPGQAPAFNSPGNLAVIGLAFIFAGVALGYDLLFGVTGLLSFGPILYFALGVYVLDIAMSDWGWSLLAGLGLTLAVTLVVALVLGSICLRVGGIAFAMVTLAFAQAGYYLLEDNPKGLTGGDSGLVLTTTHLPGFLVGVLNTQNLYFLCLGFMVVGYILVWLTTESVTGQVLLAIRDNERRAAVLGVSPFPYKLLAFVLSSVIAAGGGVCYLLLIGTASPSAVASLTLTVSVLVMVVLGGSGSRGGVAVGALLYIYLQQYLLKLAGEPFFGSLPAPLRIPLSQPQFILGAVFILFVIFVPGGMAELAHRVGRVVAPAAREGLQ